MAFKTDFFIDCAVTVLTDDLVIFQGRIIRDEHERPHDPKCEKLPPKINIKLDLDPEFIVLKLVCDPVLLTGEGRIVKIRPDLFEEGDVVRLNVNEIIAIGPSRDCFDKEIKKEHEKEHEKKHDWEHEKKHKCECEKHEEEKVLTEYVVTATAKND